MQLNTIKRTVRFSTEHYIKVHQSTVQHCTSKYSTVQYSIVQYEFIVFGHKATENKSVIYSFNFFNPNIFLVHLSVLVHS